MERWVSELEASAAAAREESIVFYRERGGGRALKAYHTRTCNSGKRSNRLTVHSVDTAFERRVCAMAVFDRAEYVNLA